MPETGIKEYIEWRGDVTFETDPFGEVDALVLAELSYVPFERVLENGGAGDGLPESLTLREAAARFDKDSVDEKLRIYTFDRDAELLALAGESARFGDIVVSGYTAKLSPERDQQFAAEVFTLPDGTRFIAFRGTDDTIAGWKEDFNISYMTETPAQKLAAEYLEKQGENAARVIVGGHSKGGNLAVYAAMKCSDEVRGRLVCVYSFDGPGLRSETVKTDEYKRTVPLITSIIPESSLVGQLLTGGADHIIVRSSGTGVLQHMAFTWEVMRNRFVRAEELSGFGMFVNKTVTAWLTDLGDEDRRMFTKALFDIIEASDAETFGELSKSKLKASKAALKAFSSLRPEQQAAMRHALKELARSGGHALKELTAEKIQPSVPILMDKSDTSSTTSAK